MKVKDMKKALENCHDESDIDVHYSEQQRSFTISTVSEKRVYYSRDPMASMPVILLVTEKK